MMNEQLQELLDRKAIEEVVARYARTLDWLDDEGQAGCYWPDADIDYGFFKGKASDFLPVVMQTERDSDRRWHMLGGLIVKFHSHIQASSECYGIFAGSRRQEDGTLAGNLFGGRYLDEWQKRAGEWRISARTYLLDWQHKLPNQPGFEPDPDFPLPTAQITVSGHPLYRPM